MVHPDFQRQNVGTELVRRAVTALAERGFTIIHVDFAQKHPTFYERCRFTIGGGGFIDVRTLK